MRKLKYFVFAGFLLLFGSTVYALPDGGSVVAGKSTISKPNARTMQINQTTNKAIINWQGYSIGSGETVKYFQPDSGSISLNRVTGVDPSSIYGQLSANGQVWVINPNGLLIGAGAKINTGGFLGSTLNIGNNDFMGGNYKFTGKTGSITNIGAITAANGGYAVFISPTITNKGTITSNLGKTYLASGNEITLNFAGNNLIGFTIDKPAAAGLGITNKGTIRANGGEVILSADIASKMMKDVLNNTGVIEAKTIAEKDGVIKLLGNKENNQITISGRLDASAPNGGNGGFIETSAAKVKTIDGAVITTKAPYGKTGTWLIDPQDYTIAASGGDITGTTLGTSLGSSNVNIASSNGGTAGNGDIFVNDAVSWSANTLTLTAYRNIEINDVMNGSGTASLALQYGQGAAAAGNAATYSVNFNFPVSLPAGNHFSTKLGSGGSTIPYTVITALGSAGSTTKTDLQGISGDLSGNYALGADIDAANTKTWNSGAGFLPIGNFSTKFTGKFDGLGHTITKLYINRPSTDYIGLFGATESGADIRNVGLTNGSVTGSKYVGGLVGGNNGSITNSYSSGSVLGSNGIGGTGTGNYVGGLVGKSYGSITDSYSSGAVTGDNFVGGLVGESYGSITDSYNSGSVKSGSNYVGGLVGLNYGSITDSYNSGSVSGIGGTGTGNYVGGLVGENDGSITDSYNSGSVTGNGTGIAVGGLVGYNFATITDSYSSGSVTGSNAVGGLVGVIYNGTITDSFWDTQTSGQSSSSGGTGKTTAQMKTLSTFSTWSIDDKGGTGKVWRIYDGDTYPLLRHFLTPLTITANNQSKTYDGNTYSGGNGVTYSPSSYDANKIFGTVSYSGSSQGAKNAGAYIITPGSQYSNQQGYDIIGYTDGTLTINKAPLTITADNDSKTYNALAYSSGNGVAYNGFVAGETNAVLAGTLTYSGTSQGAKNAGSYLITPGGETSGNYDISFNNGTLTVNKAPLTITAATNTRTYDGTVTAAAIPTVGTIYGTDTANFSETYDTKDAGTAKTLTASGTVTDNNSGNNYAYTFATDTTGVITATLTGTAAFTNESSNGTSLRHHRDIAGYLTYGSRYIPQQGLFANWPVSSLPYDNSIFNSLPDTFMLNDATFANGRFKELKQFIGYKGNNHE